MSKGRRKRWERKYDKTPKSIIVKLEQWRPIKDFEGIYEVSNTGKVRSIRKGKCLKPSYNYGYERVCLRNRSKTKMKTVHRLIALAFLPLIEGKTHINHKNGIKTDNRIENLEWCTNEENLAHAINTKLCYTVCKLNEEDVVEIKQMVAQGATLISIANQYNVSPQTISSIKRNHTWKTV